jgi:hypothetical protein
MSLWKKMARRWHALKKAKALDVDAENETPTLIKEGG